MERERIIPPLSALGRALLLPLLLLAFSGVSSADGETAPDRISMNADKISYEEMTGVATAEGNVILHNKDMRLFAPYLEYDGASHQVRALSSPEAGVSLISGGRKLSGERLDYNLETKRGVLTHPSGKVDAIYIRGDAVEVMPLSEARGRKAPVEGETEESAGRWKGAVITTCTEPAPHYRLEAKEVVVIPNKSVTVRKPRVYLGKRMLFAYPFDYIVPLNTEEWRKQHALLPKLGYESKKGAGVGIEGAFSWENGFLNMEAIAWSKEIWEGSAQLEQEITSGLTLYGGVAREYDKDRDVTRWRPNWGLQRDWNGWRMNADWTQRELMTLEKRAGHDSRYVVWRKPEISVLSPWFEDTAVGGHYRIFGTWGRYEDSSVGTGSTIERTGLGIQTEGEFGLLTPDNFQPFYNLLYAYYTYDGGGDQKIMDTATGVRWHAGDFKMETAYLRRWIWGESPMSWDDYNEREEIYQSVGIRFPAKTKDEWWELGVRGAYSFEESDLAEMVYKVGYERDCVRWDLTYRDDISGNDSWVGLMLTIKAYPDTGLRLRGDDLFEPSNAPNQLIPRSVRGK